MKLESLFEAIEQPDYSDHDPRSMSLGDRIRYYRHARQTYQALITKARAWFRKYTSGFGFTGTATPTDDHTIYYNRGEASAVTLTATPDAIKSYAMVLNITNEAASRKRMDRSKTGRSSYGYYLYIPITKSNEKFREKATRRASQVVKWEEAEKRLVTTLQRLERELHDKANKSSGSTSHVKRKSTTSRYF